MTSNSGNKEVLYIKNVLMPPLQVNPLRESDSERFLLQLEVLIDVCQNYLAEVPPQELAVILEKVPAILRRYPGNTEISYRYGIALVLFCLITRRHIRFRRLDMLKECFIKTTNREESVLFKQTWLKEKGTLEKQEYDLAEKFRQLLISFSDKMEKEHSMHSADFEENMSTRNFLSLRDTIKANCLDRPIPPPENCYVVEDFPDNQEFIALEYDWDNAFKDMKKFLLHEKSNAVRSLIYLAEPQLMNALWLALKDLLINESDTFYNRMFWLKDTIKLADFKDPIDRDHWLVLRRAYEHQENELNATEPLPQNRWEGGLGVMAKWSPDTTIVLEIPDNIIGIGVRAYSSSVPKHIIWPRDINWIAWKAFKGHDLTAAALPPSVKFIQRNAFSRCTQLNTLFIPEGVTEVPDKTRVAPEYQNIEEWHGGGVFYRCGLEHIVFPHSIIEIGNSAFAGCKNLRCVELPNGLQRIEGGAFANSGLELVTIPDSVDYIGVEAFGACVNLRSVKLPPQLKTIEKYSFFRTAIEEIEIPNSVTYIDEYAFSECPNLKQISLPKSLLGIGKGAFAKCPSLKRVVRPASLVDLPKDVFDKGVSVIRSL